jgi:diguanylate cyclase (GGDEF)-like protein
VSQRSRRRGSLTRSFALVSLVGMVALGVALVTLTAQQMRAQAVGDGTSMAAVVARYAAGGVAAGSFVTGVASPDETAAIAARTSAFDERLVELRLWGLDGRLMYSSDPGTTSGLPHSERFAAAMSTGAPDPVVQEDVRRGTGTEPQRLTVLDVYVPVLPDDTADDAVPTGGSAGQPVGVAEVVLDHTETQATLARTSRTVTLAVAGGLVVLWLLLFRIVGTTSRRLRSTALENARLAMLDSLTGLPNRRLLGDQMRRAILRAEEDGGRVGLILLDIDRFKDINDTLGHDHGDTLLEQVAQRLRESLREEDVVARLGGDEFAVLLPDVRSVANAERLAGRVRQLFARPFEIGDMTLHIDTSIGVACLPDHADDASSLMRTADVAMYAAKHHRTGVAVYSPDTDDSSPTRLVLLGELHQALAASRAARRTEQQLLAAGRASGPDGRGDAPAGRPAAAQLVMHYQPKLDLGTDRVVGYEALIRWSHPTRGVLAPSAFVPIAEQSGLIHDVTRFALEATVVQLARWEAEGRDLPVAVNLSAHDVTTPDVVATIEHLLAEHAVPARLLEVEITETALVADTSRVVPVLQRLHALGVRVAIDDFGTGTTSISQLRDLPVDTLKIDRVFISDLGEQGRDGSEVVVQAMVDLAHSFGLDVVAEGVEDAGTARVLTRLGVDQAQGFLWARPAPAEAIAQVGVADTHGPHPDGVTRPGELTA